MNRDAVDRLAIFDVDGTLCDTLEVDDDCFCATASAMLGVQVQLSAWEDAPHITDLGIVEWLWTRHFGRLPARDEIDAFVSKFAAALGHQLQIAPERFGAIAGAPQFLEYLEKEGWRFVFATGGWETTARLKLRAAGLPVASLLASSDDSRDRIDIFSLAEARAVAMFGSPSNRTVLVGDGTWDIRVAHRLGWPLLGIGRGARAVRLRDEGAGVVVPDFADRELVLARLMDCSIPRTINPQELACPA